MLQTSTLRQLEVLDEHMSHSKTHRTLKQASEDRCGTSMLTLLSYTTTRHLGLLWMPNQKNILRHIPYKNQKWKRASVVRKNPWQIHVMPKMFLNRQKLFSRCSQKSNSSSHQTQNVQWQKSRCLKIQNMRVYVRLRTESRSPRKRNFLHRLSIDLSLYRWKGFTKQKLFGTKMRNKTHVLHRMRLQPFTPKEPVPDLQTTSHEWKPDPEVIFKNDDLWCIQSMGD